MALKDWKRQYIAGGLFYTKGGKLYKEILIDKFGNTKYAVRIGEKIFKTKSQALKYAKLYMIKH